MKTLTFLLTLWAISNAFAEPLATGVVIKFPNTEFFLLRFKASNDATPGIRFYPVIRFVLDDDTWIDGHLGCFPTGASTGKESGGTIEMWNGPIPADRTLKYVAVVAAIGDPSSSHFNVDPELPFRALDQKDLKKLEKAGGVLLRFPVGKAEQRRR